MADLTALEAIRNEKRNAPNHMLVDRELGSLKNNLIHDSFPPPGIVKPAHEGSQSTAPTKEEN